MSCFRCENSCCMIAFAPGKLRVILKIFDQSRAGSHFNSQNTHSQFRNSQLAFYPCPRICEVCWCGHRVGVLYGQVADKPTRRQPTRRQTNSPTIKLADTPTRRQTNSPTVQLSDNKLADRPTRRQLNWPKKTNSPKLKLSPKSFAPWNFRSLELSFLGSFAPWDFRSLELTLPGTFVP